MTTHNHVEHVAIVHNSQDMTALAAEVESGVLDHTASHAYLISGRGLYTRAATSRKRSVTSRPSSSSSSAS